MSVRETSATCPLLKDVGTEVVAVDAAAVDQEEGEATATTSVPTSLNRVHVALVSLALVNQGLEIQEV